MTADLIIVQKSWVVIKSLLALALLLVITVRLCGTYSFSELTTECRALAGRWPQCLCNCKHANREAEKIIKMMEWLYWIYYTFCSIVLRAEHVASLRLNHSRGKSKMYNVQEKRRNRSVHNDSPFLFVFVHGDTQKYTRYPYSAIAVHCGNLIHFKRAARIECAKLAETTDLSSHFYGNYTHTHSECRK